MEQFRPVVHCENNLYIVTDANAAQIKGALLPAVLAGREGDVTTTKALVREAKKTVSEDDWPTVPCKTEIQQVKWLKVFNRDLSVYEGSLDAVIAILDGVDPNKLNRLA